MKTNTSLFASKVPFKREKESPIVLIDTQVRVHEWRKRASGRRTETKRKGGRLRPQRTWNGSPSLRPGKLPGIPVNATAMPLISRRLPVLTDASRSQR